jgi:hypothetical protein
LYVGLGFFKANHEENVEDIHMQRWKFGILRSLEGSRRRGGGGGGGGGGEVEITLTYLLNFFVESDLGIDLRLEESFAIASATTVFSQKIGDVKKLPALLFEES